MDAIGQRVCCECCVRVWGGGGGVTARAGSGKSTGNFENITMFRHAHHVVAALVPLDAHFALRAGLSPRADVVGGVLL